MPSERNGSTRRWRQLRAQILRASDICGECGQPGADAVDHRVPVARGGAMYDPSNLQPIHHDVEPRCNRLKGDKDHAPIVRRSGALN
jgi:5-methylcytosine-specific restriction endonuclease McrA